MSISFSETINAFIRYGSCLPNYTRFQTKIGKVYTRPKRPQNPTAHTYMAYIREYPPPRAFLSVRTPSKPHATPLRTAHKINTDFILLHWLLQFSLLTKFIHKTNRILHNKEASPKFHHIKRSNYQMNLILSKSKKPLFLFEL